VVSLAEAADQLGLSIYTVRRRIRDGTLAATLVGGKYDVDLPAEAPTTSPDGHAASNDRVVELLEAQVLELHQDKEELRQQLAAKDQQIEVKDRQIFELHQMMGVKALEGGTNPRRWWKPWSR